MESQTIVEKWNLDCRFYYVFARGADAVSESFRNCGFPSFPVIAVHDDYGNLKQTP